MASIEYSPAISLRTSCVFLRLVRMTRCSSGFERGCSRVRWENLVPDGAKLKGRIVRLIPWRSEALWLFKDVAHGCEYVYNASQSLLLNEIEFEWCEPDAESVVRGTLRVSRVRDDSKAIEEKDGAR